jgi:arylsulfatase A-like enzyme
LPVDADRGRGRTRHRRRARNAGFLEHTDHHLGRLVDTLQSLEVLDDTLIYYILGDNGASAEGTLNGCFNELATPNGMPDLETVEFLTSKLDAFGGPDA